MTIRSIALFLALGACVRSRPTPDPGYWVASDSSQYTPVVRLRAHVDVQRDRVLVNIDSGTVSVPGEPMRYAPPLMSNLYLSAVVAVPDSNSFTVGRAPGVVAARAERFGTAPPRTRIWRARLGARTPTVDSGIVRGGYTIPVAHLSDCREHSGTVGTDASRRRYPAARSSRRRSRLCVWRA